MFSHATDVVAARSATGATLSADKAAETDPALFARELERIMTEQRQTGGADRLARTLERLAAAFPDATVDAASPASASGGGSGSSSIFIEPDMLQQLSGDESLFAKARDAIQGLFAAGQRQSLAGVGDAAGATAARSVTVTTMEIRYTETRRNSDGALLSETTLRLEHARMMSDLLDLLLASVGGSGSRGGKTDGGQAGKGLTFDDLLGGTDSWRLEGFLSLRSFQSSLSSASGDAGAALPDWTPSESGSVVSLEIVLREWSGSAGQADVSGFDFLAYVSMRGLVDPLVLDLGGEGIRLSSAEDGVTFDIRGDGTPARTAFIRGDNAFLFLDQNGNNVADDANELFGDQGGHANGYEKLRLYDDNGDGVIDAEDEAFGRLRLWRDLNGDGVCQEDEVMSLDEAGIVSLNLNHDGSRELDGHGNVIADRSTFTRADGSTGGMADVWLRTR